MSVEPAIDSFTISGGHSCKPAAGKRKMGSDRRKGMNMDDTESYCRAQLLNQTSCRVGVAPVQYDGTLA